MLMEILNVSVNMKFVILNGLPRSSVPSIQAGSPLKAGEVHLKNVNYPLPDLGILGPVVQVFCYKISLEISLLELNKIIEV